MDTSTRKNSKRSNRSWARHRRATSIYISRLATGHPRSQERWHKRSNKGGRASSTIVGLADNWEYHQNRLDQTRDLIVGNKALLVPRKGAAVNFPQRPRLSSPSDSFVPPASDGAGAPGLP